MPVYHEQIATLIVKAKFSASWESVHTESWLILQNEKKLSDKPTSSTWKEIVYEKGVEKKQNLQ